MRIGIITFHRAHNYGAVLQCYALSTLLQSLGYNVEVIDYYPSYFKKEYELFTKDKLSFLSYKQKVFYLIKYLLSIVRKYKRIKSFNSFIEKLPLSEKQYNEQSSFINNYDIIIYGSDQIWNPLLTYGQDKIYSGNFKKGKTRFVSYAASTNIEICYNNKYTEYFKGIIKRFDAISVREESFCTYLNSLTSQCSKIVLDPVLLLDESVWSNLAIKPVHTNYLLIYTVPQSDKIYHLANLVASKFGLKIVEIRPNVTYKYKSNVLQTLSPSEFLGYFKYASYIVTTSFHGTAFSLKFNKQFLTLKLGTHVDDRATNLLESLDLSNRLISHDKLLIPTDIHNYSQINFRLNSLAKESIDFIKSNVKL